MRLSVSNTARSLSIAKQLISNQFDFVILEKFSDSSTISALRTAFKSDFHPSRDFVAAYSNRGVLRSTTQLPSNEEILSGEEHSNQGVSSRRRLKATGGYGSYFLVHVFAFLNRFIFNDFKINCFIMIL